MRYDYLDWNDLREALTKIDKLTKFVISDAEFNTSITDIRKVIIELTTLAAERASKFGD